VRGDCCEILQAMDRRFPVILADPPWGFKNWSDEYHTKEPQSRWVGRHYTTMTEDDLLALPVFYVSEQDSVLLLWATFPNLPLALRVMASWGFEYKTVAFTWLKTTQAGTPVTGMGYYTRSNQEIVLLGTRGKVLPRKSHSVPQVVMAPRGAHSAKPEDVQDRIEALFDGPYLELFARRERPGWTCIGQEVE
jgi:N6-adenosine-specific RNA methylase IME4